MITNNQPVISAATIITASRGRVYSILADYREGHPGILPPQFTSMAVEQGGVGAGTIIRFTMRLLGRTQRFRAALPSPSPDVSWGKPISRPTAG
jgi:hypothetical protein